MKKTTFESVETSTSASLSSLIVRLGSLSPTVSLVAAVLVFFVFALFVKSATLAVNGSASSAQLQSQSQTQSSDHFTATMIALNSASHCTVSIVTYSGAPFAPTSALASSSGSSFARFLLAAGFFSATDPGAEPEALRLRAERRGSCAGASDMVEIVLDVAVARPHE